VAQPRPGRGCVKTVHTERNAQPRSGRGWATLLRRYLHVLRLARQLNACIILGPFRLFRSPPVQQPVIALSVWGKDFSYRLLLPHSHSISQHRNWLSSGPAFTTYCRNSRSVAFSHRPAVNHSLIRVGSDLSSSPLLQANKNQYEASAALERGDSLADNCTVRSLNVRQFHRMTRYIRRR